MLNYWLGEARNFGPDRALADTLTTIVPALPQLARTARAYRDDAVRAGLEAGIVQVLDLGAGIPAARGAGISRHIDGRPVNAVYVDQDPVAVQDLRQVLSPSATVVSADVTMTDALLDLLAERHVVDLRSPTIVLLTMTMHHLATFQVLHLLGTLRRRLIPGSRLVVTSFVSDPLAAARRDTVVAAYTGVPDLHLRTVTQTGSLLLRTGWRGGWPGEDAGLFTAVAHTR